MAILAECQRCHKKQAVKNRNCLCGEFRCDFIVAGSIVLELKALEGLTDDHIAQGLSYLKATRLKLAILLNFGTESLRTKRLVL